MFNKFNAKMYFQMENIFPQVRDRSLRLFLHLFLLYQSNSIKK